MHSVACWSLLAALPVSADEYVPPRGYVCCRVAKPIVIDGKLEAAWEALPWSEPFVDIEGDRKPRPRHRTRMKMAWDDRALYIAARLDEPHVWGTLTRHDSVIFHDNDFEVFLDPDGDNHLYGELELNALNTTWDLLLTRPYRNGGRAINAWEIRGLRTAVRVEGTLNDPRDEDRGWTVEIAWPWDGLRELGRVPMPPRPGNQWRINFSRVQWEHEVVEGKYRKVKGKREDNWVWSPQGVINMHMPERWGYVQFSDKPPGAEAFRPDPAGPTLHRLHQVHEAQLAYRKVHRRWARSLEELGVKAAAGMKFEATTTGYEVSLPGPKGEAVRYHLNAAGRVWAE